MRIINVRNRTLVESNFYDAQARIRGGISGSGTCADTQKPPVNLGAAAGDTAQFTPVATPYRALYMG
jgi:hypothetical protein